MDWGSDLWHVTVSTAGKKIEPLTIHRPTGPENAGWRMLGVARQLSLPFDLVEFDMDHVTDTDTYDDIQSLGTEKLLQVYQNANLSIRPKTKTSRLETIKEMIRALGENPEAILAREVLAEGATTQLDNDRLQDHYT